MVLIVISLLISSNTVTVLAVTPNFATRNVDFNGDGRMDITLFDSTTAYWHTYDFYSGIVNRFEFGSSGDLPAIGDYDGDGFSDLVVFHDEQQSGDKLWQIASGGSEEQNIHWGRLGDVPVPADYDGDGKTDVAVFRPSNATWYMLLSKGSLIRIEEFGTPSDKLAPADYDGDGLADLAFVRPSEHTWYVRYSRSNVDAAILMDAPFSEGDTMVPADYDGDGIDDQAVYHVNTGYWIILESASGNLRFAQFGNGIYTGDQTEATANPDNLDRPMPGDFDGDNVMDLGVWSPKSRVVNVLPSQSSQLTSIPVGNRDSKPISLAIVSQIEYPNLQESK
jgi:hypothetical protein